MEIENENTMDVSTNDLGLQLQIPESQTPMYLYDKLHQSHSKRFKRKRLDDLGDEIVMSKRKRKKSRKSVTKDGSSSDESSDDSEEELDEEGIKEMIKSKMGDLFASKDEDPKGRLNHIYFNDNVTKVTCRKLIEKIDKLNIKLGKLSCDYDMDHPPKIYLHINSFGGSIFAALSVIDAMRRSKFPIVTIIEGASASSATLISVFGNERWITKHGYMLIHQLSSVCWGKMAEIEDEYENLKEITNHIYEIYEEKTKMKRAELRNLLKHDRWWRAEECLKKGLVDKII